ncbi:MAG: efflux RND transporter permease subunit [Thermoanaerobaculia bacterium]|nr:efflux RND transporter permease subunit [Thermoanaerobaculia bacterium]
MSTLLTLLSRRKLVLTASLLLSLMGALFWLRMPRQEDPRMPDYWGQVLVSLPGADAETVERQLLDPLEEQLAGVDDLAEIEATAYPDLVHLHLQLREGVKDTQRVWDDVREALVAAQRDLPAGASEPELDDNLQDQESIVLALIGDPDVLRLQDEARRLEDRLLALPLVSKVRRIADPGEQITIALEDAAAAQLGRSTAEIVEQLRTRTQTLPGGNLRVGDHSVTLKPRSELESIEEIRSTPILLADGSSVPLGALAAVQLQPRQPERARMSLSGVPAVGLGVIPRSGANLVDFGNQVRTLVDGYTPQGQSVEVREVIFQPERVAQRLSDLSRSLLLGIAIVALLLVAFMGLRVGLLVASVVPLVVLSSLAVFALAGGTLQQISVAALVIALGMLVDNAIVMTESLQWRLDHGENRTEAAVGAVRELVVPLAAATATTLAVFVPMLLSQGATAEFTRSIPIVIMITLTMSYLYAVFFTPAVASRVLRPRAVGSDSARWRRLSQLAIRHRRLILVLAGVLLLVSFVAASGVRKEFFPASDRNQFLVEIELPEGTHLDATSTAASAVEAALLERPEVTSVLTLVGRSVPHFYYNLNQIPWSSHLAQMVVETSDLKGVAGEIDWIRAWTEVHHPEIQLVARALEQGPPVLAPIELRLFGESLEELAIAADLVSAEVSRVPGTVDVRHDLGPGAPLLRFEIDDAAAGRVGVDRRSVAQALYGRTRGLSVGELRSGDDPIPILVRSAAGEDYGLDQLGSIDVRTPGGQTLPLSQVARTELEWSPAAINHRNRRRVVRVLSQLTPGESYSDVLRTLRPRLAEVELPSGVEIEYGGAVEGSGQANDAMLRTFPVGALLLIGILMAEFNSFRRLAIILATVPLAAAGVIPGLLLADQPFGFMSLLGIIALVGVVVNNAIVLLDVIESEREGGSDVESAVASAVERRTRPILLTSATTVAGLIPLALSGTTLWPPLAWTLISGLVASTALTLLVVPALYLVLFPSSKDTVEGSSVSSHLAKAALLGLVLLVLPSGLSAQAEVAQAEATRAKATKAETGSMWTVERVAREAAKRPAATASRLRTEAARHEASAVSRGRFGPQLVAEAGVAEQDRDLTLSTAVGDFQFGSSRREHGAIMLVQPLVDLGRRFAVESARQASMAEGGLEDRRSQRLQLEAIEGLLALYEIDARLSAGRELEASLDATSRDTEARVRSGRELEVSALKFRLALLELRQQLEALERQRAVVAWDLARRVAVDPEVESFGRLADLPDASPTRLPSNLPLAVAEAFERRLDLRARQAEAEATRQQQKTQEALRWPRLDAQVGFQWDSSTPFADDLWAEGGLAVSWRPWQSGRSQTIRALESRHGALAAELEESHRDVELEVRQAWAALATAREERSLAEASFELAAETRRVEKVRYEAGRVTANDLLVAEADLAQQNAGRTLARVAVRRARTQLDFALGRDLASRSDPRDTSFRQREVGGVDRLALWGEGGPTRGLAAEHDDDLPFDALAFTEDLDQLAEGSAENLLVEFGQLSSYGGSAVSESLLGIAETLDDSMR